MRKFTGTLLALFFLTYSALPVSAADVPKPVEAPAAALQRVIDILEGQAADLRQGLVNLVNLDDTQKQKRQVYLIFLDGVINYYESLQIDENGANVKAIATEIKSRRQSNYQTEIKKISDFVLVFQAMHILDTAQNRFSKIDSDLDRLVGLGILKAGKPDILLNDARASLATAEGLMSQAVALLDARTQNETLRFLITDAIGKIRQAYKDFFAISNYVAANTAH